MISKNSLMVNGKQQTGHGTEQNWEKKEKEKVIDSRNCSVMTDTQHRAYTLPS